MKNLLAACAAGFILAAAGVEKAPDALKVVFYCDRGVGVDLVGRLMDDCPEFVVTFANGKDIGEGALDGADMVVHSGGSGESQFFGLGEKGVAAEREFVKKGGLYHGTCAGAPNVYAPMGYNTPEGARLLQKVWHSTDYNRVLSSAKGDVALLIDPKKKTFKELKDFKGPVVVLSTHADTAAEIKASGRKDLIVAASAAEASAKLKDSLAKLKADKAK